MGQVEVLDRDRYHGELIGTPHVLVYLAHGLSRMLCPARHHVVSAVLRSRFDGAFMMSVIAIPRASIV